MALPARGVNSAWRGCCCLGAGDSRLSQAKKLQEQADKWDEAQKERQLAADRASKWYDYHLKVAQSHKEKTAMLRQEADLKQQQAANAKAEADKLREKQQELKDKAFALQEQAAQHAKTIAELQQKLAEAKTTRDSLATAVKATEAEVQKAMDDWHVALKAAAHLHDIAKNAKERYDGTHNKMSEIQKVLHTL